MADLTSVLVMAVFMMLSSFASVQGYPSRPSRPNAGYEDLLVRIEQALGRLSVREGFSDELARINVATGNGAVMSMLHLILCFAGNCRSAMLSAGCCIGKCHVGVGQGCFCDSVCRSYKDCCDDVPDEGCLNGN